MESTVPGNPEYPHNSSIRLRNPSLQSNQYNQDNQQTWHLVGKSVKWSEAKKPWYQLNDDAVDKSWERDKVKIQSAVYILHFLHRLRDLWPQEVAKITLKNAFSYFIVLFFGTQLIFNFNWFFWWFFNLWWIISWLWKSHLSLIFVELQSMMGGGGGKFLPCFFPWMTDIDATLNMTRRKHTRAVVRSRV